MCQKINLSLLFVCVSVFAQANMIINISVPQTTPLADEVFVSGNFNGWQPNVAAYKCQYLGNYQYTVSIPAPSSTAMEFKVTRGTWATVECMASGADIGNRTATYSNGSTQTITVANWKDMGGTTAHTLTGNCGIMTLNYAMPQLNTTRRVWLYLPPDYYTNPTARYPVLYMQDGQNLFDDATSFSGEWGIDEAMQAITCAPKAIVVGIDNGGSTRLDEYSPWVNAQYGGGQGDVYMDWLANNLKPYIDNTYRTLPDRAHTGIMGSSMGGLISFYGAMQYQNVFGKAGIMSPSFWFSNQVQPFITAQGMQADGKFYFVCGGNESSSMVSDMDAVIATMQTAGFAPNTNTKRVVKADGQHAEWFWKREFAAAYCWLFSDLVVATQAEIGTDTVLLNALQNPFGDSLTLHLAALAGKSTITIHDISGKKVYSTVVENTEQVTISTAHLPKGSYVVGLQNGAQIQTIQVIK